MKFNAIKNVFKLKIFIMNINIRHACSILLWTQGHAAPILYAAWAEAGLFPAADLLNLRKVDNDLEGHPTPVSGAITYK